MFNQHISHLNQVFTNLRAANLTLQPSKCKFATKEIEYLGHVISKNGIKVNPNKTKAIDEYPCPKTVKQLKSFLGMASYYRKFIRSYAKIATPLTSLLKKDVKFEWSEKCQDSFNTLKKALTSAPVLAYPKFDRPFILATDSSEHAIGYVLSQLDDQDKEHPIAFGGRALHGHETRWHITDKEGLALVEAVSLFRPYLANSSFTVYTNNISVKWLKQIKKCQGRLGRWALTLQGYNFQILHKASSANGNADGLSRRTYPNNGDDKKETMDSDDYVETVNQVSSERELAAVTIFYSHREDPIPSVAPVIPSTEAAPNFEDSQDTNTANLQDTHGTELQTNDENNELKHFQSECHFYKDIINYKLNNELTDDHKKAKLIVAQSDQYEILPSGHLVHLYSPRTKGVPKEEKLILQVCIPAILRDDMLRSFHDSLAGGMHQGFERTYAALRQKYYWPTMFEDCRKYIQSCEMCQRVKRDIHGKPPPLQPMPVADLF